LLAGGKRVRPTGRSKGFACAPATWYKSDVGIRRTKHAVYDLKYHLVWVPKYRAHILDGQLGWYLKEVFRRIAEEYEFHIDTMEVMEDHVHVFVEAPPGGIRQHSWCKCSRVYLHERYIRSFPR